MNPVLNRRRVMMGVLSTASSRMGFIGKTSGEGSSDHAKWEAMGNTRISSDLCDHPMGDKVIMDDGRMYCRGCNRESQRKRRSK